MLQLRGSVRQGGTMKHGAATIALMLQTRSILAASLANLKISIIIM